VVEGEDNDGGAIAMVCDLLARSNRKPAYQLRTDVRGHDEMIDVARSGRLIGGS